MRFEKGLHDPAGCRSASHRYVPDAQAIHALQRVATAMEKILAGNSTVLSWCNLSVYGSGWGKHELCSLSTFIKPDGFCTFWSFGTSTDASFDLDLIAKHGCHGMALDPSVSYATNQFGEKAVFTQMGARLKESSSYQPTPGAWFLANVPLLARALSIEKLQVLKMDCEGCEYALADDILKHDELFLDKVDQFAIEVHTTAMIAKTRDHALALGRLYHLLQEAGLELVHAAVQYCNDEHAAFGHQEEFIAVGYPHTRNDYCQNLLFAKRPRA
jgi:hypothetical protein